MSAPDFDRTSPQLFPMAELSSKWGITANTVSRRIAFLGIKPTRVGNYRFLTEEQLELAEALHQHVLAGRPMEWFERPGQAEEEAEPPKGQVVRRVEKSSGLVSADQMAAFAAALAAAMPQQQADPFRRARGLAEAADSGLVLTTDELAELGVKGIGDFEDGDLAYGFRFTKHNQRKRNLWTVERDITSDATERKPRALPGSTSHTTRPVGFAALVESPVVEATYRIMGSELFSRNKVG